MTTKAGNSNLNEDFKSSRHCQIALRDLNFEIRASSLLAVDALGAGRNADDLPRGGDVAVASADDDAGHYAAFGVSRGAEERLVLGCHELADLVGEGVTLCHLLGTHLRGGNRLVELLVVKMTYKTSYFVCSQNEFFSLFT